MTKTLDILQRALFQGLQMLSPVPLINPVCSLFCKEYYHKRQASLTSILKQFSDIKQIRLCRLDCGNILPSETALALALPFDVVPQADGFPIQESFSHAAFKMSDLHSRSFLIQTHKHNPHTLD